MNAAIGLDTSVVVRFLTNQPATEAELARDRIREALQAGQDLVVPDLAVAEAYYVLHKLYGIPKDLAVKALRDLFRQPGWRQEASGVAVAALEAIQHAKGKKPGLVDRMLHARCLEETERMITFEKAGKKLQRTAVLRAPKAPRHGI